DTLLADVVTDSARGASGEGEDVDVQVAHVQGARSFDLDLGAVLGAVETPPHTHLAGVQSDGGLGLLGDGDGRLDVRSVAIGAGYEVDVAFADGLEDLLGVVCVVDDNYSVLVAVDVPGVAVDLSLLDVVLDVPSRAYAGYAFYLY